MTKERLEEILKENGINMITFISSSDYNAVVESMKKAVNEAIQTATDTYWLSRDKQWETLYTLKRISNLKIKD